mgnify:CR=1 FL=1
MKVFIFYYFILKGLVVDNVATYHEKQTGRRPLDMERVNLLKSIYILLSIIFEPFSYPFFFLKVYIFYRSHSVKIQYCRRE